ncbi:TetR/AcrR family transcriptional regulator [Nocardia sp. NPDC051750]|uniref:TetR/AcrR family transcriptional regulator n=1 Tax=Nocardia sp. NPDC051750 TaxID=3364325 RepID=UPI003797E8D0
MARLLQAARELITDAGPGVALDEIARHAGVGNATLYRHFPTRADLLVAVYSDEIADLCRDGAELAKAEQPLDALFTWLEKFIVHLATKRPLALAATEEPSNRRTPLFEEWHTSITTAADVLVDRARAALRPDITTTDVLTLATGVALAVGADADHTHRLVTLFRTGLASREAAADERSAQPDP